MFALTTVGNFASDNVVRQETETKKETEKETEKRQR